ncbi:carbonic anhydrase family protein [Paenibacillus oralis]|uniref:Carbonic anhydrase n=1 Tax=Paenibacillus oralis TaxID=2490856 RepID=A0A3P3U1B4_9BACL|nr:carbonic anhydrase family protein [Paenibacillus oralis]RRJ63676.1 carbonic anhydrase family protein [Paenibacillus oralis]
MKKNFFVLGFTAFILLAGCSASHAATNLSASKENHFTYDHQEEWEFVSGKMQSPIDIVTSQVIDYKGAGLVLNYDQAGTSIEDNGHSIQVGLRGTAEIDERSFALSQVHFHAESEHTIDGKHYPLEGHFVHKAVDGRIAVIGVMFTAGKENQAFGQILEAAKANAKGEKGITIDNLDIGQLLPAHLGYYHYLGSLTTPPLTENVEWYILKDAVQLSQEQLDEFYKYYDNNHRDIQELNDRKVFIKS